MNLIVSRIEEYKGSTIGVLLLSTKDEDVHLCYTLEDGFNEPKIPGETRIPFGIYKMDLRTVGGFNARYSKATWIPENFHKGMLWIRDVPGFTYILHHTGNTKKNTEGCLLYGVNFQKQDDGFFLKQSRKAYKKVYPIIRDALLSGEDVTIEYKDNDR